MGNADLLTPAQVHKLYGLTRSGLHMAVMRGQLVPDFVAGGCRFYRAATIEAYLEKTQGRGRPLKGGSRAET